jgi:hypothetical protein
LTQLCVAYFKDMHHFASTAPLQRIDKQQHLLSVQSDPNVIMMQTAVDEKEDDTASGNEAEVGSQSSQRRNVDIVSSLTSTDETGGSNDGPGQASASVPEASLSSASSAQHLISNTSTNQALSISGRVTDSASSHAPSQIIMPSTQLLNGTFASLPHSAVPGHFGVHMPHFMNGDASLHTLAKAADAIDNPPRSASMPFRCMLLYLEQDKRNLSPYQRLARKQIELFEATDKDLEDNAQGRNRPICLRQVGIRCLHCGQKPAKERTKGSVFFPSRLVGVYQTAQNMANTHFVKDCKVIPKDIRDDLLRIRLKDTKLRKSSHGGGREYWASCLRGLGVIDTPDRRLRFSSF